MFFAPCRANVINYAGDAEIAPTDYLVSKRRGDLRIARHCEQAD